MHACMQAHSTHKHAHTGKDTLAYTSNTHIDLYIDMNTKTQACTRTHTTQIRAHTTNPQHLDIRFLWFNLT